MVTKFLTSGGLAMEKIQMKKSLFIVMRKKALLSQKLLYPMVEEEKASVKLLG